MSIGDATKTLASRIWENWIPFGSETVESEISVVASARLPLADIFSAGTLLTPSVCLLLK